MGTEDGTYLFVVLTVRFCASVALLVLQPVFEAVKARRDVVLYRTPSIHHVLESGLVDSEDRLKEKKSDGNGKSDSKDNKKVCAILCSH